MPFLDIHGYGKKRLILPPWFSGGFWLTGASPIPASKTNYYSTKLGRYIQVIFGRETNNHFRYDTVENVWSAKADVTANLDYRMQVVTVNDVIYIFGTYRPDINNPNDGKIHCYMYDPSTDSWTAKAVYNSASTYATESAVVVGNNVYIIGKTTHVCYNTLANTYTSKQAIPNSSYGFAAASVGDNIYTFGGIITYETPLSTSQCYNTLTNTWTTITSMPYSSYNNVARTVGTLIYVAGGSASYSLALTGLHCYDTITKAWSTKPNMPIRRCSFAMESINNKFLYFSGGDTGNNTLTTATDCYVINE